MNGYSPTSGATVNGAPVLGWKGSVTIGGNAYATLRSGSLSVDFNRDLLMDVVEHVTCRWCKAVDQVEIVPRPAP